LWRNPDAAVRVALDPRAQKEKDDGEGPETFEQGSPQAKGGQEQEEIGAGRP
jgi:hypothetical protein